MASKSWADDLATCETVMDVVITIYFWAGVRESGGPAFRRAAEARILEITTPHELEITLRGMEDAVLHDHPDSHLADVIRERRADGDT